MRNKWKKKTKLATTWIYERKNYVWTDTQNENTRKSARPLNYTSDTQTKQQQPNKQQMPTATIKLIIWTDFSFALIIGMCYLFLRCNTFLSLTHKMYITLSHSLSNHFWYFCCCFVFAAIAIVVFVCTTHTYADYKFTIQIIQLFTYSWCHKIYVFFFLNFFCCCLFHSWIHNCA